MVDFPGGPVVKNPPAGAGDMSSIPGLGRFHNFWASTLEAMLCNMKSYRNEKLFTTTREQVPLIAIREKAHMQQRRPSAAKKK